MNGTHRPEPDGGKGTISSHVISDNVGGETQPLTGGRLKSSRARKSKQVRFRLSPELQDHLGNLPAPILNQVITVSLATTLQSVGVRDLVNLVPELRNIRRELFTINQVTLVHRVPINTTQVNEAIRRLNLLLGDTL